MNTADSRKADDGDVSGFAPSWWVPAPGERETEAARSGALTQPGEPDDAPVPRRLWRLLLAARVLVAGALLALEAAAWWLSNGPGWIVALCAAHVALSAGGLLLPRPPARTLLTSPRWLLTVWADLGVFAALQLFAPGGINFTPLFVWPVLLAAVLGPRLLALGVASAGTLVLLIDAARLGQHAPQTADWLQAAITGTGLLSVALLASHLTLRLVGEQTAARRTRRLVALQGEVNRLIATGLGEGVIVMDARGAIWYANPAATRMLGLADAHGDVANNVRHAPGWPALSSWARAALRQPATPKDAADPRDLTLPLGNGLQQRVRLRLRLAALPDESPGVAVLFLEDLHDVEVRVRNEKLAAMGRVSAAVAHEIRNPLAAIAQASALLQEDDTTPAQRHLIGLIAQNVRRLNRTVDDVLETARTPWHDTQSPAPLLTLDAAVDEILTDWLRQRPQGERLQRHAGAPVVTVAFDPEHLQRVLVNLLDNADRHAVHAAGAIRVETAAGERDAHLIVWSDSAAIPPTVREHLFEPFMSSHSRSSGLGLYLSRELCQRYHADLSHERTARGGREGNAFEVKLPVIDGSI